MTDSKKKRYSKLPKQLRLIIQKANEMELEWQKELDKVHPIYNKSGRNLVHYLAFRSFDIDELQAELRDLGLPSLTNIEGHVMRSLINLHQILESLAGKKITLGAKGYITVKKSDKVLRKNAKLLFGYRSKKRSTRIMVTLPNTAAPDVKFVNKLIKSGMNCARINCAHDDVDTWTHMIENVKSESLKLKRKCKIAMDLSGPKLRTGAMIEGPKVIHIKPKRDDRGNVIQPAWIWIAPPDIMPPPNVDIPVMLPVDERLFSKIKRDSKISFVDSRGKKCKIFIERKEGKGMWGLCTSSAYLETGTAITLKHYKQSGREKSRIGEILPKQQFITLFTGDTLLLHKDTRPGETTQYNDDGRCIAPAHIACTLPQIFNDVKAGEPIFFDDGKIEGVIEQVSPEELKVKILLAKDKGSKLKADKGINLPESKLNVPGLTNKDLVDLNFVAGHADVINYSFVNSSDDVKSLQKILNKKESKAGIILKIETQQAFNRLPSILLTAMRTHPVGVMIARGDLAIEIGWKNFPTIQQEIMRICEAAHIPDIWATQVLESLAKKGTPSRAEITDAAMAQQAECVMLNKGYYILKAVKMLDKILRRMQRFQQKSAVVLPKLDKAHKLHLSHRAFDV